MVRWLPDERGPPRRATKRKRKEWLSWACGLGQASTRRRKRGANHAEVKRKWNRPKRKCKWAKERKFKPKDFLQNNILSEFRKLT